MLSTIDAITQLLFIETPIKPADLIFVFGNDWVETMHKVKELYDQKISSQILITGHSANKDRAESEARRFMTKGLELGTPESAFILEHNATNTKENFELSIPFIEKLIGIKNIKSILFICKTFHTRRVLMTAKIFLSHNIEFSFLPIIDERNIQKDNWWLSEDAKGRVLAEVGRISEYSIKGDLSIL